MTDEYDWRQYQHNWVPSRYPNGHHLPAVGPCPYCGRERGAEGGCSCIMIDNVHVESPERRWAEENQRWADHYIEASRRSERHHGKP